MSAAGKPRGAARTVQDIMAGVRLELDPGETVVIGCDGRVTTKVPFLGYGTVIRSPYKSHFLVLTDRRVLVFAIAPKAFSGGLAAPPVLRHQAPRDSVCVAAVRKKRLSVQLTLGFAEGTVPFEGTGRPGELMASLATVLPPCGPHG